MHDLRLSLRSYKKEDSIYEIITPHKDLKIKIGGLEKVIIAGPCSVEWPVTMHQIAQNLKKLNLFF